MDSILRLDNGHFHALVENSLDIITVLDRELLCVYYSPSAENMLGYDKTELLGKSPADYIHPDDLKETRAAFIKGIGDPGYEVRTEYRFRHKDGSWRNLESRAKMMSDGSAPSFFVVNSRDVTEKKAMQRDLESHREQLEELVAERTRELEDSNERLKREISRSTLVEEELRERESGYRLLAENVADVIWTTDLNLRFTYVSPSIERVTGFSVEEAMAGSIEDGLTPASMQEVKELITKGAEAFQAGKLDLETVWTLEAEQYCRDGSTIWIDLTVRLLKNQAGLPVGLLGVSRDIAERKQVEDELRRSERYFRALTENAHDIIIMLDASGRMIYASPSLQILTGYSLEDLSGEEIFSIIDDEDVPRLRGILAQSLEDPEKTRELNYRVRYKDGSWHHHEAVGMNLLHDPAVRGIVINARDVSERLRIEKELKGRQERYRFLIENAQDVILVLDGKGNTIYMSPSGERVLGYTPEEMMNMRGFSIIRPEEVEATVQGLKRLIADPGKPFRAELNVRHKDGSWRNIEIMASNFLDHPTVRGIIVNFRDNTERKQARRRLERINHLFLSLGTDLFENMEKIVETCRDVLGGTFAAYYRMEKGRLAILSTAEGLEGFIVTRSPHDYLPFRVISLNEEEPLVIEDLAAEECPGTDSLAERFGFRSLLVYPVKSSGHTMGCICYYEKEPRAFSHEDMEIMGMLARALTVEEERLAREENLKDFLDVASHELRHPITLMKGYAVTINRFADKLDDKSKREYLEVIERGADRLDTLIRELLDGSRIERGRFTLHKQARDLGPLLERAVKEMTDKGCVHKLTMDTRDDMPAYEVDAEKLVRVLVILMDNAASHSPANFPIEVSLEQSGGKALITVMDRGVGIPQEDWERIFERFYQVEDALHHTTRGMGLGLFIAREIVEKHGGRIWYEPRLGGGSIFRFTLS